jgi:UDP-glucose 4-epimerase
MRNRQLCRSTARDAGASKDSVMSVLVTGGAGYIGSHMALELLDAGETVVVLDNLSTGVAWGVPKGARFVDGNVGDQGLVARVIGEHGIDAIIHFAGSVVVPDSVTDPLGYYHNNTVNSRALIEVAVKRGVRHFIFSSTAAVYGMTGDTPVTEDAPLAPMSPYGSSKRMTEIMLADAAAAHDLRYVALRYFNVAGADPQGRSGQSTPRATHLVKVACETALGKRSHMQVFGTDYPTHDGTCVRDYIHVTDLTGAHMAALRHLCAGGGSDIFNCGYGRGFSVLEVIEAVRRAAGRAFEVRMGPRRAGDPGMVVAATERIRTTLAWTPRHDNLDAIVRSALKWEERLTSLQQQPAAAGA